MANSLESISIGSWDIQVWLKSKAPDDVLYTAEQQHGAFIVKATDLGGDEQLDGDGIVSNAGDPIVGVRTADCMPLAVVANKKAAVLHISRKTLVAGILESLRDHIRPEEITDVVIGPHICDTHFSFQWAGDEIVKFQSLFPSSVSEFNGTLHLSLRSAIEEVLKSWCVEPTLHELGSCTLETPHLPSYKQEVVEARAEQVSDHIVMTLHSSLPS